MIQGQPLAGVIDRHFLNSVVQQASLLVRAGGSAFYLCAPTLDEFELAAAYGPEEAPWSEELISQACASRKAAVAWPHDSPAMIAVPSIWRDKMRGVLVVVGSARERAFGDRDLALLQPLA